MTVVTMQNKTKKKTKTNENRTAKKETTKQHACIK